MKQTPGISVDINFAEEDNHNLMPSYKLFGDKEILFPNHDFQDEKKLIELWQDELEPATFAQPNFDDENYDIKAASGLLLTETEKKAFVF